MKSVRYTWKEKCCVRAKMAFLKYLLLRVPASDVSYIPGEIADGVCEMPRMSTSADRGGRIAASMRDVQR